MADTSNVQIDENEYFVYGLRFKNHQSVIGRRDAIATAVELSKSDRLRFIVNLSTGETWRFLRGKLRGYSCKEFFFSADTHSRKYYPKRMQPIFPMPNFEKLLEGR